MAGEAQRARELGGVCGLGPGDAPFSVHCGDSHAVFLFQAHRHGTHVEDLPEGGQAGGGAFFAGDGGAGEPAKF